MAQRRRNNLQAERDQVRRKIRNAQSKVRRLENNGITDLGRNSPFRPNADINRYTRAQLNAYARQLDKFTSRSAQFVADTRGRAIPRAMYQRYEQLARARQKQAQDFFYSIEDVLLGDRGFTVGEAAGRFTPDRGELHNPSANPIRSLDIKPSTSFDSERAMRQYIKSLGKQTRSGYLKTVRKQAMPLFDADEMLLLKDRNGKRLIDRIKNLSNQQLGLLWNAREFTDALSDFYETEKLLMSGKQTAFSPEALRVQADVYSKDIEDLLDVVENPKRRGK